MTSQICNTGAKQLMIIDTDCGIDDALAILLALSYSEQWEILAITCCHGNTTVENVSQNVLKILNAKGETSIPVYHGCSQSIICSKRMEGVFGKDGFGNVASEFPTGDLVVSEGHAVNILVHLAREHQNQITLVALAPLTNIAVAQKIDPEFTRNLKSLVVMGGNYHGIGNITNSAEFNFYGDPEAAHIVFSEADCSLWLVTWETALSHGLYVPDCEAKGDLLENAVFPDHNGVEYSKKIKEMCKANKITGKISSYLLDFCMKNHEGNFLDCDFLAVAAVVCPQSIEKIMQYPVSVEIAGNFTRGQAVIERFYSSSGKERRRKVNIVTQFNDEILNELRFRVLQQ